VELREVGHHGVQLSAVGLGGAWLGSDPADAQTVSRGRDVVLAAADAGMNWLDTSENYFDSGNEAAIGAILERVPESFLVCTKLAPGVAISGGGSGFRPAQVRAGCLGSLRRLRRPLLDAYLLHWPDETGVPLDETWGAMAELVDEGLVRAIGLSNYSREDIASCHAQRPVDLIQTGLSLLDYLDDRDLIAWCGTHGIAVTIYEPVCNGILSETPFDQVRARWAGTPWEDTNLFRRLFSAEAAPRAAAVVDGLRHVARDTGATVSQLAIAWVLRQSGVTAAIAGSSSVAHTRENSAAGDLELDDATLQAIEDLVPLGPAFA
jgi:aryl-alcohol dehydrogenase-like predicted oxidoreductase